MEQLSFKLEAYEGPLDLLLTLITKNKIDIYDIPIAVILDQYLAYLEKWDGNLPDVVAGNDAISIIVPNN